MLISDRLLGIERQTPINNNRAINETIIKMVKLCIKEVQETPDVITQERIYNVWDYVTDVLIKENRGFIKRGGLKTYINLCIDSNK